MFAALFANHKSKPVTPDVTTDDSTLRSKSSASTISHVLDKSNHTGHVLGIEAPIIGILGAKGGVGATTIAVNLATALSLNFAPITLIDGNMQQPEIAHTVGIEPKHSYLELLSRMPGADRKTFEACLVELNGSDLGFLSPPLNGDACVQTNLTNLAQCLQSIRSYSRLWLVDLPRHLDKHLVSLTDKCEKIILVFEATVTGVAAMQRWLSIFRELGYEDSRIICLLNRSGSKYKSIENRLTDCFGDKPIISLPNASSVTWDCSTRATSIIQAFPNHQYSRATMHLAEYVTQSILRQGEAI